MNSMKLNEISPIIKPFDYVFDNIGRKNNRKTTKGRRTQYIKYVNEQGKTVVKCIKHKAK